MYKTIYVVCDEHTLGYLYTSSAGVKTIGCIHTSTLKGSYLNGLEDWWFASQFETIRPATAKDFEEYHCTLPPDFE